MATSRRQKLFGASFPEQPLSLAKARGADWRTWIEEKINAQKSASQDQRLHYARHRHFRAGRQWISTRDGRTWRELDSDMNTVRAVLNIVGPALDFRLGLIDEQHPGFKVHPLGTGIAGRETAEAQQNTAEFYYNKLRGQTLLRASASNAQTDGIAFLHVYVDKHVAPQDNVLLIDEGDEQFGPLLEQGYDLVETGGTRSVRLPLSAEGAPLRPGAEPEAILTGEVGTRIVLAHQVTIDPDAKTINGPRDRARWLIIERVRDVESARAEAEDPSLEAEASARSGDPILDSVDAPRFERGLPVFPATRTRYADGMVHDYLVYIAPDKEAGFPRGLWRRIIADKLITGGDELPGGKIPLARMTDGSSDDQLFPRPVMSDWIGEQLTINALLSRLIEHVRVYGVGRTLAQEGTILKESYSDITGSVVTWRGTKPEFLTGTRASSDSWGLLNFLVQKLEDKTGWNDLARGAVTGSQGGGFQDVAGRGILAARELFERQFGPMIRATAEGMSEWSQLVVDYARFLFADEPRMIPRAGRPDLAARVSAETLGEESLVYIDPETMSPLPRSLRNQLLFDMMSNGLITVEEYRRRAPFAEIRNVEMGDTQQWERAQTINTMIEEQSEALAGLDFLSRFDPEQRGIPLYWQDDPAVHHRALNELVLDERQTLIVRDIAAERWAAYALLQQAQALAAQGIPFAPMPFVRGAPSVAAQALQQGEGSVPGNGITPGATVPGASAQPLAQPAPEAGPLAAAQGAGLTNDLETLLETTQQ